METSVSSGGDDSAARVHLSGLSKVSALIREKSRRVVELAGGAKRRTKTSTG